VTGVEDKLQDNADAIMDYLKQAGIKVWMLTGDKVETAICIGTSIRLITPNAKLIIIDQPATQIP